jgi:F-type H+-transporting ATPase subunit delta
MKIGKQARRDAKDLFTACRVDGVLDETRVRRTVSEVISQKPRNYIAVLQHFQRLVKLDLDRRTVRVENAVATSQALMDNLGASLTWRYGPGLDIGYWINPELIGGLRIKVGSDVYDGSVRARLAQLENSF